MAYCPIFQIWFFVLQLLSAHHHQLFLEWAWESQFSSSVEESASEHQCKQSCVWMANAKSTEKQNVSCRFQTISGYGWIASPEEFEHMIIADTFPLNPPH